MSHAAGSFASDNSDLVSSNHKSGSGRVVTTPAERTRLSRQESQESPDGRKIAEAREGGIELHSTPRAKSKAADKTSGLNLDWGKGDDLASRSSTSSRSEPSGAVGGAASMVELLVNTFSSHDREGRVVGVCLVGQDVTRAREAERAYARLQGDYEAIVNTKHRSLMPPIFACNGESPSATRVAFALQVATKAKGVLRGCLLQGCTASLSLSLPLSLSRSLLSLSLSLSLPPSLPHPSHVPAWFRRLPLPPSCHPSIIFAVPASLPSCFMKPL